MLPARPQGNITTTTTILRTRPSNGRCYSPVFVLLLAAVLTTLPSSTAFVSHHHPTALYRPTRQTRQSPQFIPLLPKTTLAPTVVKSHQNYRYPHSSCLAMTTGTNRSSGESSLVTPPTTTTTTNNNHLHHPYSYKRAVMRTAAWVSAAVVFGGAIWTLVSPELGEEFFAGYLVEQSLSVDNLFVFLLLFEYFQVPLAYQDRVLNWGIYGAIVMRGIMISLGVTALENFHQILLVFAGILVYSSAKFFLDDNNNDEKEEEDPSENSVVQFSKALLPSVDYFENDRFFTVVDGIRRATPLFICMVAVEISDVVFAVDSIPAVFGVTEVRMQWVDGTDWCAGGYFVFILT